MGKKEKSAPNPANVAAGNLLSPLSEASAERLAGQLTPASAPKRRRGLARFILGFILGLFRLAATTALVLGLTGAATYLLVRSYVSGPEVKVPNVCGATVEEALEKMKPSNLLLEMDRREDSEVVPRGHIIAQFPAPGMKVKAHTPLRVVLSDGSVRVRVPNLVGLSEVNAGVAARAVPQADLDLSEPSARVYSPTVKKGDVIAQDPPGGTPILRGSKIKLVVSLGPRAVDYNMPDLRNKTIQEARTALGAMQLTLGEVHEEERAGSERGIVVAQDPSPGRRVASGTAVSLTVATGLGGTPRP